MRIFQTNLSGAFSAGIRIFDALGCPDCFDGAVIEEGVSSGFHLELFGVTTFATETGCPLVDGHLIRVDLLSVHNKLDLLNYRSLKSIKIVIYYCIKLSSVIKITG